MRMTLKCGRDESPVTIPDSLDIEIITPRPLRAIDSPDRAILSALDNPIASPSLKDTLPGDGEVAMVVSDKTRSCLYPQLLPVLLDYLNACGVPDERMFLLVAYGSHPRHSETEDRVTYGEEVIRRLRLVHHDCRDGSQLYYLGRTGRGTQVRLNRKYLEAATTVVLGGVAVHYFAGFGGGRKMIFPGLASEEGILHNHRIFVEATGGKVAQMRRFKATLKSHPLHEDLTEAAALAPPSFSVNLCLNEEEKTAGVFAGDWVESHRLACELVAETCVPEGRKYDLVIASCGGYPKDINFIQAHKTIDNAFGFVREGGTLVVLARCEDGMGSKSFLRWFDHANIETMREALLSTYTMNGGTALALKAKAVACEIHLHSGLDGKAVEKMGLQPVRDVQKDVVRIVAERNVRTVAILPEGANTVARPE
jgi:lactate racemase